MKICPQCQMEYDDTGGFCHDDGSLLQAKMGEGATAKANPLTCTQCGKLAEAGRKFCPYCGARLGASTQPLAVGAKPEAPFMAQTQPLAKGKPAPKTRAVDVEQDLARAPQTSPPQDAASMLATVEERKGEQAQREGNFIQALACYQKAAEYGPGNEIYTRKIAHVLALRAEESRRKRWGARRLIAWGVGLGLAVVLLGVGGVFAYRTARGWFHTLSSEEEFAAVAQQEQPAPPSGGPSALPSDRTAGRIETTVESREKVEPSPSLAQPLEGQPLVESAAEEKPQSAGGESGTPAKAAEPVKGASFAAQVVTVEDRTIEISGPGGRDAARSEDALRSEIGAYFPELRQLYESHRRNDPVLLGSLSLETTLEPDGQTSRVRFLPTKIANKDFLEAVQGFVRTWHFSPAASGQVVVRYPLLFVPPGTEAASVLAWERRVAPVAQAIPSEQGPEEKPQNVGEARQAKAAKSLKERLYSPTGMYVVVRPTPVLDEPRGDSVVITQLDPRTKVYATRVAGDYLEVRFGGEEALGFIHRGDAIPLVR